VGEPGNERVFADNMIAVLEDPGRAERIGTAGQAECFAHLDYGAHASGLAKFFASCIERRNEQRSARKDDGQIPYASMAGAQADNTVKRYRADSKPN
jgi:hypothetical protein